MCEEDQEEEVAFRRRAVTKSPKIDTRVRPVANVLSTGSLLRGMSDDEFDLIATTRRKPAEDAFDRAGRVSREDPFDKPTALQQALSSRGRREPGPAAHSAKPRRRALSKTTWMPRERPSPKLGWRPGDGRRTASAVVLLLSCSPFTCYRYRYPLAVITPTFDCNLAPSSERRLCEPADATCTRCLCCTRPLRAHADFPECSFR